MVEPAFIQFERDGSGEFVFGAVSGQLDCRYDKDGVAFTWQGQDELTMSAAVDTRNKSLTEQSLGNSIATSVTIPDLQRPKSNFSAAW